MTNKELNQDIKKMFNTCEKLKIGNLWFDGILQKEFKRLYFADQKAEVLTLKSLKIMIFLNSKFKIIPLEKFYTEIKI